MNIAEFLGYAASILVFATFYMKTMVPLRCVALVSNIAFITYAYLESLFPVLILHLVLFPTNVFRLFEIYRLLSQAEQFREIGFPLERFVPFMSERAVKAGEVLFHRGDPSNGMYYLARGSVRFPEFNVTLSPGEIFGEIGLFAPENKRTATAIVEESGVVFWLSERSALLIFQQNPSIGVLLIRVITERLIDNYKRLEASPVPPSSQGEKIQENDRISPSAAPDPQKVADARLALRKGRQRRRLAYSVAVLVPVVLLVATLSSQRKYFASVIFRDAVVTSWRFVATAPISGLVDGDVPKPGDFVDVTGQTVKIVNPQVDQTEVARLEAELERNADLILQLEQQHDEFLRIRDSWKRRSDTYSDVFMKEIELEIAGLQEQLDFTDDQLKLTSRIAGRLETLADKGSVAPTTSDQSNAEVTALQRQRSGLIKQLTRTQQRMQAAKTGVFITSDGNNPNWVFDSTDLLELRIIETEKALAEAHSERQKRRREFDAAQEQLKRMQEAIVLVTPGSLIWSVQVGPNSTVGRGAAVLEWVQCDNLLVDVPVSNLDLPFLKIGDAAEVSIDGVSNSISGIIEDIRGSAGRLGVQDLAAVSEAGASTSGQVLVQLLDRSFAPETCPIGQPAYVDFPSVGPIDRLRAFFRLD